MKAFISRKPRRAATIALLAAFGFFACSGSLEPCDFNDALSLTVGAGTAPRIQWRPGCKIGHLSVEDVEAATRVETWFLFDADNSIGPVIFYGVSPLPQSSPAQPLQPGRLYRVRIGLVIGGDAVQQLAVREFRP